MTYTMDSTFGDILNNPKVKPVLDQYVPGVADHPMVSMVKGMTLQQIVDNPLASQFGIDKAKVQSFLDAANKVT